MKLNIAFWVLVALFCLLAASRLWGGAFNPKIVLLQTLVDPITWALIIVGVFWQKRRQSRAS